MPSSDTQFKPGHSGNPGGRPKRGWTWADLLEEAMEEELTTTDGKKDKAKKFITKRLVKMAIDGDLGAQKEIMDRMEGKPKQSTDITSGGDKLQTLLVEFINNKDAKDTNTNGV